MGWDETREILDELESDPEFSVDITRLDPVEHRDQFRKYGLVVCPSFVYRDEVIAVGPPNPESIKERVKELSSSEGHTPATEGD
jgi:hypothetical protein